MAKKLEESLLCRKTVVRLYRIAQVRRHQERHLDRNLHELGEPPKEVRGGDMMGRELGGSAVLRSASS